MADELHLALLGHLEIRRAGAAVPGFTSNKVQALLCYLAVTGRSHLRPALAGLLWGELSEASAQNSLRKALSNLHQLLGPYVDIRRDSVAFNRNSAYWLDVEAFEAGVGAAAGKIHVVRLEKAAALYQGDFLAGFYVRDAPAFEEWALAQRARLRMLALQALHTLAIHHSRLGEDGRPAAIDYTTRLLALEPWREEAHLQLMLLLAASGQRSAALAQYETCRRLLAEELGAQPSEEIRETYELLLRGEQPRDLAILLAEQERAPRKVGECPYRGLSSFQEADATFFFGREALPGGWWRLYSSSRCSASWVLQAAASRRPSLPGCCLACAAGRLAHRRLRPGAQPFHALANALLGILSPELGATGRLLEARKLADALAVATLRSRMRWLWPWRRGPPPGACCWSSTSSRSCTPSVQSRKWAPLCRRAARRAELRRPHRGAGPGAPAQHAGRLYGAGARLPPLGRCHPGRRPAVGPDEPRRAARGHRTAG